MNTYISNVLSRGKSFVIRCTPLVFSAVAIIIVYSFVQFTYPTIVRAAVTVNPTDEISDHLPQQDETTDFIQSFYSTGATSQDIVFIAKYWPSGNPSNAKTVTGIGHRDAGTPATALREITLDIPYADSAIVPGAAYEYQILDTTGVLYYKNVFVRPTVTGPAVADTIAVTSSLSADGQTVTFTITGSAGVDVDFKLSYSSTANSTFSGHVDDIATRLAGATTTQTFSYTLGTPGQFLVDSQGFAINSETVSYDLMDYASGKVYVSGSFGANPTSSGGTTGNVAGGTTVTPVQPTSYGVNIIIDDAPDLSGGLVPCDGRTGVNRCTWGKLVMLVNNGLTWLIYMTVPIAAAMFAYAGFLFLTKGTSEEARSKAKGIFINVFIGVLFIVGAVLIIKTILVALIDPNVGDGYSSFL